MYIQLKKNINSIHILFDISKSYLMKTINTGSNASYVITQCASLEMV